ncbi:MAG: hypothetical protein J6I56_10330 [Lachnospiraceae bacterium]|nr:hypothetical protein [Lachnospiraceae bacterium]
MNFSRRLANFICLLLLLAVSLTDSHTDFSGIGSYLAPAAPEADVRLTSQAPAASLPAASRIVRVPSGRSVQVTRETKPLRLSETMARMENEARRNGDFGLTAALLTVLVFFMLRDLRQYPGWIAQRAIERKSIIISYIQSQDGLK